MATTCDQTIYVGDIGTIFRVTATECVAGTDSAVDISGATSLAFTFQKPDGTTLGKADPDVALTTDGTDGKVEYASISGDLDQDGVWKLQARFVLSGGQEFATTIATFDVDPVLS
jgi:hypothetical protein